MSTISPEAERLHREALVVDAHTHGPGFLPLLPGSLYRLVNRRTMPNDVGIEDLPVAGVDAVVLKAVGDPIVTRWNGGGPWAAVLAQLDRLEEQVRAAGATVVTTAGGLHEAKAEGRTAVVLGIEGADFLGRDPSGLNELHRLGVRVVVPVHLGDNDLGTTCLPWQRYAGPLPVRRRSTPGLTAFGAEVVGAMNELGMVVDLAHADRPTLLGAVEESRRPVISSHSGARALQDFARYLGDEEIRAVAATGGVVGLWPYRHRGWGMADVHALVDHARHVASLVGPGHLCLGTDMNGVPGVMVGYRDERDLPVVTDALLANGFSEGDVRGILGGNVARVLAEVTGDRW